MLLLYPKYPEYLLLCAHRLTVVINLITVEAACCEGEFEVCESNGGGGGGVGCTRAALLALLELDKGTPVCTVLNRGMEHSRDVDDHIWTERSCAQALRASVGGNYSGGKKAPIDR